MIIDSHAHVVMPPQSFRFMAELIGGRGNPSVPPKIPDEAVRKAAEELVAIMDGVGTDLQFISPRPYLQMHSVKPARVTELWTRHCNDIIARIVACFPDRFRGVAGLPQYLHESPAVRAVDELKRCVEQLGFVGCLINPDPTEGSDLPPPGLGDPFWHPLYEAMTALDVPGLIHSAGSCSARETHAAAAAARRRASTPSERKNESDQSAMLTTQKMPRTALNALRSPNRATILTAPAANAPMRGSATTIQMQSSRCGIMCSAKRV